MQGLSALVHYREANYIKVIFRRCLLDTGLKCYCDQKNNSYFSLDFKTMLTKQ